MSAIFFRSSKTIVFSCFILLMVSSCKPDDNQISKAVVPIVATVAPDAIVSVQNGVVTLRGTMPDEATKSSLDSVLRKLKGVVSLRDQTIVPVSVVLAERKADSLMESSINSGLKTAGILGLTVNVTDSVVTLNGNVNNKDMNTIRQVVDRVHPKKVLNGLTVKK